jgi:hypothetical protein
MRRFATFAAGADNALLDVKIKCTGKSYSKLTPESTLTDLVCVYGHTAAAARAVKNFIRAALGNDEVRETTALGWFLESDAKAEQAAA